MLKKVVAGVAAVATLAFIAVGVSTATGPDPAPVTQVVSRSCTTDTAGYCTVTHSLGVVPETVLLTPVIKAGGVSYMLSVVTGSVTATSVRIRAMRSSTNPYAGAAITFSLVVYGSTAAPTTSSSTTTTATSTTTTTTPPVTTTTTVAPPPPGGFPNASNTGTPPGTVFTRSVGLYYATTPNEVLDRVDFTDSIVVQARGVVITNSRIADTILIDGDASVTVEDTTVGPPEVAGQPCPNVWNSGISTTDTVGSYTARRVKIQGHEDGLKASGTNMVVEDSYINACGDGADHSDGIQDYPIANGLVLNHNTFEDRGPGQNGAVYINAGDKGGATSTNVRITNNLGLGGAYTFYLWPAPGWVVTGNRAVLDPATYGPYQTGGRCGLLAAWSDNDVVTADSNYNITTVQDNFPCPN